MNKKIILLVEDNPDDETLTKRALNKDHILNEIVVTRDGSEALDYLFGTGTYSGRDLIEGYSLGANSYIRKPLDFSQFSEAIAQLKLYWLVLNESPPNKKT